MRGAWFRGAPFRGGGGGGGGKSKELGSEVQRCLAQGSSGQRYIPMFKGARVMGTPVRTSGGGDRVRRSRVRGSRVRGDLLTLAGTGHFASFHGTRRGGGGGGATPVPFRP